MKQGVNLATRPIRTPRVARAVGWLALVLMLAGSVVHFHQMSKSSRRVGVLREDVERLEGRMSAMRRGVVEAQQELGTPASAAVVRLLVAVETSGATRAASPVRVLTMMTEVLPPEARILSMRLQSSPPEPELVLEAVAEFPETVARLLGELSHQPSVIRAEILDERHLGGGEIYLRIGIDLEPWEGRP